MLPRFDIRYPALALGLLAAAQAQNPTCFDQNLGTNLGLGDDALAVGLQLPFAFPLPGAGGLTTSAIDVSSNGFIYLESGVSTSSGCCNGDPAALVSGPARIAPWWQDLQGNVGDGVYFASSPQQAVITWNQIAEFGSGGSNTVQLILFPDGSFQMSWRELTDPGSHDVLVGVSPGNNVVDPGEIDYSVQVPYGSAAEPTIYELFTDGVDTRDLAGRALRFLPNGQGGYDVIPFGPCASAIEFGEGCPNPAVLYELFVGAGSNDLSGTSLQLVPTGSGGYTVLPAGPGNYDPNFNNMLPAGDDLLHQGLQLGFTIPIPGAGMVSAIDADTNGWCAPAGLFTRSDLSENVDQFLNEGARFAMLWDDLNPNAGGGVYFDTPRPGVAMVTWDQVPQYNNTDANSFQIQFRADGSILMVWQQVADDSLVGFSVGGGVNDPGMVDLDQVAPVVLDGGVPLRHAVSGPPVLGANVDFRIEDVPSAAVLAVLNFGFVSPGIDMSPLGAAGCTLLSTADASVAMPPVQNGATQVSLAMPNMPALLGATLYTQGAAAGPLNSLGIITSNGVAHTFGY